MKILIHCNLDSCFFNCLAHQGGFDRFSWVNPTARESKLAGGPGVYQEQLTFVRDQAVNRTSEVHFFQGYTDIFP
jgi:hypothetical protein